LEKRLMAQQSVRRIALVGTGQVARSAHLPILSRTPGISVVAIADQDAASLSAARILVPGARTCSSLSDILRSEKVDIVDICTPPAYHANLIIEALESGAHVLCEKPFVLRLEDMEKVRETASRTGKVVYSVHNWKFAPQFLTVRQWIQEGLIGKLQRIELHTLRKAPAFMSNNQPGASWRLDPDRAGGGVLADHGWHLFSLALGLSGLPPRSIWARLGREKFTSSPLEDTAFCRVNLGPVQAFLYMSWAEDQRRNSGVFQGDKGSIFLDDDRIWASGDGRLKIFDEALSAGSSHPEWFGTMFPEFLRGLDTPDANSNLDEASHCLSLLTSAYESARQNSKDIQLKSVQPATVP
jgi:predicted dehydrogenase